MGSSQPSDALMTQGGDEVSGVFKVLDPDDVRTNNLSPQH